jgi:hypothetical protein
MAKQPVLERYKGFLIDGSAVPTFATGFDWYSQGIILRPGRLTSIVEVKHIEGGVFNSKEAAEQHGLQLCKDWIDKRLDLSQHNARVRCLLCVPLHRYLRV